MVVSGSAWGEANETAPVATPQAVTSPVINQDSYTNVSEAPCDANTLNCVGGYRIGNIGSATNPSNPAKQQAQGTTPLVCSVPTKASNIPAPSGEQIDQSGDYITQYMTNCLKQFQFYLSQESLNTISLEYVAQFDNAGNPTDKNCKVAPSTPSPPTQGIYDNKFLSSIKLCLVEAYVANKAGRQWKNKEHYGSHPGSAINKEKCTNEGILTLDFEACEDFANHYQIAAVAQQFATDAQGMKFQLDSADASAKAAQSTDAAIGIKTQQSATLQKQDIMNQQAVMEAAKLATLTTDYNNMPTIDNVLEKCNGFRDMQIAQTLHMDEESCKTIIKNGSISDRFLPNSSRKDEMKKILFDIGAKAAVDTLQASMLGNQADKMGNAIAAVNGFAPIAPAAPGSTNLMTNFCQLNPSDPQCATGGLSRTYDALGGSNVIDFGTGGTGSIYTQAAIDPLTNTGGPVAAAIPTNAIPGSMGTNTVAAGQAAGLKDTAAAAQLENKPGGGGGGSGGGGAGGGGGTSGGGAAPGAGNTGGVQSAIAGRQPTYLGGGGSLSMMGGFGIQKSNSKSASTDNPFGKMFNKNVAANNSLNFRGPASVASKGDNLFNMISNRYSVVNAEKRINEYEPK